MRRKSIENHSIKVKRIKGVKKKNKRKPIAKRVRSNNMTVIVYSNTEQDIEDYLVEVATFKGYPLVKVVGKQATVRWDLTNKAHEQNTWWCELHPQVSTSLQTQDDPDPSWLPPVEGI